MIQVNNPYSKENIDGHVQLNQERLDEVSGKVNVLCFTGPGLSRGIADVVNSFKELSRRTDNTNVNYSNIQATEYLLARTVGELAEALSIVSELQLALRDFRLGNDMVIKLRKGPDAQ